MAGKRGVKEGWHYYHLNINAFGTSFASFILDALVPFRIFPSAPIIQSVIDVPIPFFWNADICVSSATSRQREDMS
ncbi:MAG TPA: hypothetical protein VGB56_09420 [Flavisolibacter sp.]|jgi:hypothetical protein